MFFSSGFDFQIGSVAGDSAFSPSFEFQINSVQSDSGFSSSFEFEIDLGTFGGVSETLSFSDAVVSSLIANKTVGEILSFSDVAIASVNNGAIDTLSFSDAANATMALSSAATESLIFGDAAITNIAKALDSIESLTLADIAAADAIAFTVDIRGLILKGKDQITGQHRQADLDEAFTQWLDAPGMPGSWVSNASYDTSFRVIGDTYESRMTLDLSGAPNSGSLEIILPINAYIDTNKFFVTSKTPVGQANLSIGGTDYTGVIFWDPTLGVRTLSVGWLSEDVGIGVTLEEVTEASPATWGAGDKIDLSFQVPVIRT
jgi:hypothetical protein